MVLERVQKIMAASGIASRRKCEDLIDRGLVEVNGKIITLGDKADIDVDEILFEGKKVVPQKPVYIILNKPKG